MRLRFVQLRTDPEWRDIDAQSDEKYASCFAAKVDCTAIFGDSRTANDPNSVAASVGPGYDNAAGNFTGNGTSASAAPSAGQVHS